MKTGEEIRSVHALHEYKQITDNQKNIHQYFFEDEGELLESFRDHVVHTADPDIFTGYNTHNFDWPYMEDRAAKLLSSSSRFWYFSRLLRHRCKMKAKEFSSKAFGFSNSRQYLIPGRVDNDLFTYMKRNFNFKQYNLAYVSKKLLNNTKVIKFLYVVVFFCFHNTNVCFSCVG